MRKLTCINDRNLPEGANVVNGREYYILDEFINGYEQRTFIVSGVNNRGTTKNGLRWQGYCATRFADLDSLSLEGAMEQETNEIKSGVNATINN
jgi:hypothetical protein